MGKTTRASIPIHVSVGSAAEAEAPPDDYTADPNANGAGDYYDDPPPSPLDRAPLFSGFDVADEQEIDHVVITRIKPVREGDLGQLPAESDEESIRGEFGGGSYQLQGRNKRKRPVKGAYRTIDLAGDPIFRSDTARREWEQLKRQRFGQDDRAAGATVTPIRSADDQSALEQDRHGRELARIKAEAEAYALRAKADLDLAVGRAKAEGDAAIARAKAEGEAGISRARAESDERATRDRAFYEAQQKQQADFMLAMKGQEKTGDPLMQLKNMAGILADLRGDSGGHAPDVATAIVENLDKILGAVDSVTSTDKRTSAAAGKGKARPAASGGGGESVTLTDSLAVKAKRAAAHLARQGIQNPAAALSQHMERTFDRLLRVGVVEGGKGKPAPKKAAPKGKK